MFKKITALMLAMIMAVGLTACGTEKGTSSDTSAVDSTVKAEDITVAGIVYLEDQFMKLLSTGYTDAAKEYGVKCLTSNVNNDQSKETNQINTYVTQGVNGICIAPLNEKSSMTTLESAASQGTKITLCDSTLQNADFIVGGYTSDQTQLGASTGEVAKKFISEKLGGEAKIAVVQFKSLLPEKSGARTNGFLDIVKTLPGVEVVADQDAWMQDDAVAVVNDILTAHPDVDIIFAANDGGTVGSTMAVKNAGMAGSVYVFGIDASEQIASMLQDSDNILQAVTGQDAYSMGYKSMEKLIKNLLDEDTGDTAGTISTVDGILLNRADQDGITAFLTNLSERTGS